MTRPSTPFLPPAGCLSVIVPLYNEEATVPRLLEKVAGREEVGEILVVDDASRDGSVEAVKRLGLSKVRLLRQEQNRGKGAAVRRGLREANCSYVVIQDADLEYDPADYPKLLEPLLAGRADAVYGNRFHGGRPRGQRALFYAANRLLSGVSNRLTGYHLRDMHTCYKVLSRPLAAKLDLSEERFAIDPEITGELARLGALIEEVPIRYEARDRAAGKKLGWRDGLEALRVIWHKRRKQEAKAA